MATNTSSSYLESDLLKYANAAANAAINAARSAKEAVQAAKLSSIRGGREKIKSKKRLTKRRKYRKHHHTKYRK